MMQMRLTSTILEVSSLSTNASLVKKNFIQCRSVVLVFTNIREVANRKTDRQTLDRQMQGKT